MEAKKTSFYIYIATVLISGFFAFRLGKENMTQTRVGKPKVVKTFEIRLETEDPEYVNETWLKYVLNDAFLAPEFHEPEGDHPPRLLSVKQRLSTIESTKLPLVAE